MNEHENDPLLPGENSFITKMTCLGRVEIFFSTLWKNVQNDRIRVHRTLNLYLGYFGLGLCMSILGPTLPDIQRNIGTDTTMIGYALAVMHVAVCFGALAGGYLYNRFHRLLVFTLLLFLMGVSTLAISFQRNVALFFVNLAIFGFLGSAFNTGGNVLCLDLWQPNPGPFFQALHFFFGLGSVASGLIAEPFLSPEDNPAANGTISNATTTQEPTKAQGNIVVAYSIVTAFIIIVSVSAIAAFLIDRSEIKSNTEKDRVANNAPDKILPRFLIGFGAVFVAFYLGMENTFTSFLTTFVNRSDLKLTKSDGSFMTSVFFGCYCFVRCLSIYGAAKIKPLYMLIFNLIIIALSAVVLSIWGESHAAVMWVGSATLGMGCASTFASSVSWMENYVGISNFISGLFLLSGAVGGSVMALIVGYAMDIDPTLFLYTIASCGLVCICAFAAQLKMVRLIESGGGRKLSTSSTAYLDQTHSLN